MMEVISKTDAKTANLKHYYTGIPCKNNHLALRLVRNGVCVECRKIWDGKYAETKMRSSLLTKAYGINEDDYNSILLKQQGVCAICKMICKSGKNLSVDHNHKTGKIRGLLCTSCNYGLGHFKDNIQNIESAISYLLERVYSHTVEKG